VRKSRNALPPLSTSPPLANAPRYKVERKDDGLRAISDDLLADFTALVNPLFPSQCSTLSKQVRRLSRGQLQGPFLTLGATLDYNPQLHTDGPDLPITAIFWLLAPSAPEATATFHLPELRAWWRPRHGSLVVLDSSRLLHGTNRDRGDSMLMGVAIFSKRDTVTKVGRHLDTLVHQTDQQSKEDRKCVKSDLCVQPWVPAAQR
jgi:hypothetical protein